MGGSRQQQQDRQLQVADGLTVPVDLVTERIFITGNPGSGKTNTAVVLVEELLDHGQQVVIVDPLDVWWGLKSSGDGQRAGYPAVVFGGHHPDLPLAAGDGATIADMVVDHGITAVLSLSRFEEDDDMVRFVTDFARRLYFRKDEPKHRRPLHFVLDEASLFIPPTPDKGDGARLLSALRRISRQGRVLGLGMTTIDQRPASVNTNVRNLAELVITHRLTASHDREAMEKWMRAKATPDQLKTYMGSMASLPQGTAWFWSPEWLGLFDKYRVRLRRTFDSSATPRVGAAVVTPKKLARADLDALRPLLAKTMEEARANDPEELKARILDLERRLAAQPPSSPPSSPPPPLPPPPPVQVPIITPDQVERMDHYLEELAAMREGVVGLTELVGEVRATARRFLPPGCAVQARTTPKPSASSPPPSRSAPPSPSSPPTRPARDVAGRDQLTGPERKILDAYAWWHSIGVAQPDRTNIAPLAGYSNTKSKGFTNPLSSCHTAGLVEDDALTERGRQLAEWPAQMRSLAEHHQKLREVMDGPQRKIFDALIKAGGSLDREALAAAAGYGNVKSKGFTNPLSRLSAMGLVASKKGAAAVKGTELIYPPALLSQKSG